MMRTCLMGPRWERGLAIKLKDACNEPWLDNPIENDWYWVEQDRKKCITFDPSWYSDLSVGICCFNFFHLYSRFCYIKNLRDSRCRSAKCKNKCSSEKVPTFISHFTFLSFFSSAGAKLDALGLNVEKMPNLWWPHTLTKLISADCESCKRPSASVEKSGKTNPIIEICPLAQPFCHALDAIGDGAKKQTWFRDPIKIRMRPTQSPPSFISLSTFDPLPCDITFRQESDPGGGDDDDDDTIMDLFFETYTAIATVRGSVHTMKVQWVCDQGAHWRNAIKQARFNAASWSLTHLSSSLSDWVEWLVTSLVVAWPSCGCWGGSSKRWNLLLLDCWLASKFGFTSSVLAWGRSLKLLLLLLSWPVHCFTLQIT